MSSPVWGATTAIIRTVTWLAIFEHNYHPRIYRYSEEATMLRGEIASWISIIRKGRLVSGGRVGGAERADFP